MLLVVMVVVLLPLLPLLPFTVRYASPHPHLSALLQLRPLHGRRNRIRMLRISSRGFSQARQSLAPLPASQPPSRLL